MGSNMTTPARAANAIGDVLAGKLTTVSYDLPPGLTYAQWEREGRALIGIALASQWWCGDWLVYGEREFPDRYEQAIEATGLQYQTLLNYAWLASTFPPEARHETLTMSHHQAVAARDDAETLLKEAERDGLTTRELRELARDEPPHSAGARQVECPHCGHSFDC